MKSYLNSIKILILTGVIIMQAIATSHFNQILYVVLVLAFILNNQMRKLLKHDSQFIITILIDLAIATYLVFNYSSYNSLLLIISLVDIFTYNKFTYASSVLVSVVYTLLNIFNYSNSTILALLFFYCILLTQIIIVKKHIQNINLNYLYDDIRRYSYELERAKAQIELYSAQVSELSTIKERNRIAEDIHDSVGHQLTSLLFRLQACEIEIQKNSTEGLKQLSDITETLRSNLVLLRNKVKNVEVKSYTNFSNSINSLISTFKKDTAFKISYVINGNIKRLSPEIETILFNNIRESLTNAARHSNGTEIVITINYTSSNITLTVFDNGTNNNKYQVGYGLRAMKNRTTLLNGEMIIDTKSGFLLTFIIPYKEQ